MMISKPTASEAVAGSASYPPAISHASLFQRGLPVERHDKAERQIGTIKLGNLVEGRSERGRVDLKQKEQLTIGGDARRHGKPRRDGQD